MTEKSNSWFLSDLSSDYTLNGSYHRKRPPCSQEAWCRTFEKIFFFLKSLEYNTIFIETTFSVGSNSNSQSLKSPIDLNSRSNSQDGFGAETPSMLEPPPPLPDLLDDAEENFLLDQMSNDINDFDFAAQPDDLDDGLSDPRWNGDANLQPPPMFQHVTSMPPPPMVPPPNWMGERPPPFQGSYNNAPYRNNKFRSNRGNARGRGGGYGGDMYNNRGGGGNFRGRGRGNPRFQRGNFKGNMRGHRGAF